MVIIEMSASGMPVISTRHCDIPGVVLDGETGQPLSSATHRSRIVRADARIAAALALACLAAGCSLPTASTATLPADGHGTTAAPSLAGRSWRLVAIRMMNDTVHQPRDASRYTLSFRADGRAAIRADCNRGTAHWRSDAPAHVELGAIATTRALCPPGSISERFLAQLQWVRSYVLEDEHLFLATRADGSIIELEPIDGPAGDS